MPRFASNLGLNPLEPIRTNQIPNSLNSSLHSLTNQDNVVHVPSLDKTIQPSISSDKSSFNEVIFTSFSLRFYELFDIHFNSRRKCVLNTNVD